VTTCLSAGATVAPSAAETWSPSVLTVPSLKPLACPKSDETLLDATVGESTRGRVPVEIGRSPDFSALDDNSWGVTWLIGTRPVSLSIVSVSVVSRGPVPRSSAGVEVSDCD
jgi:hypothetical protein